MNPLALPVGTIITVTLGTRPSTDETVTLERTARGFIERDYHCVDCAAAWEVSGEPAAWEQVTSMASDSLGIVPSLLVEDGPWKVDTVPAGWLTERVNEAITTAEDDYSEAVHLLRQMAVDAGLS